MLPVALEYPSRDSPYEGSSLFISKISEADCAKFNQIRSVGIIEEILILYCITKFF